MAQVPCKAVVMLSGGMDSATCLAIAAAEGCETHALSFNYHQRHQAELAAAAELATQLGAASHQTLNLDLGDLGGSALTDSQIAVPESPGEGIPVTYVPARNTVFLSLSLALAEVLDAERIYVGVNAIDYSGYPDCRPEYLAAFQAMANLATKRGVEGRPIEIRAPLLQLSKGEIVQRGSALGVDFSQTVSCYQADTAGRACGRCDACRLRRQGFTDAGISDPTRYRAQ